MIRLVSRSLVLFSIALATVACVTGPKKVETRKPVEPRPVATPLTPQPKLTIVAVFDIEDPAKQFDSEMTTQLTDYLASRVNEVAGYRIIPREQVRQRLRDEKAEGYRACYDEACQIELGKALAAEKSLATKVLHVGSTCLMTATLFDLKTETTERSVTAKTECNATALITGADQLAQELRAEAYESHAFEDSSSGPR